MADFLTSDQWVKYGAAGALGAFLLKLIEKLFKRQDQITLSLMQETSRQRIQLEHLEKRLDEVSQDLIEWKGKALAAAAEVSTLKRQVSMLESLLKCPFAGENLSAADVATSVP